MKANEYLDNYLSQNVRVDSLRHIHDYILNNDVKRMIEFGTSRVDFEGNSTIFLALLAKEKEAKFTSVDINQDNLDNAKSIINRFSSELLEYIEFVCDDQYNYMKNYNQDPSQYVYLDCDDGGKNNALVHLVRSKILDTKSLICVDDMSLPYGAYHEINGVIEFVNNNFDRLKPLERNHNYSKTLNQEQINSNSINKEFFKNSDNCLVHKEGVKQYAYQILLQWRGK